MTHDYLRQPTMMQLKAEDIIGQKCEKAALSVSVSVQASASCENRMTGFVTSSLLAIHLINSRNSWLNKASFYLKY